MLSLYFKVIVGVCYKLRVVAATKVEGKIYRNNLLSTLQLHNQAH